MKINLPVTQNEKPYPKGRYLVSKTDLKGIITYANDTFIELAEFSREELIGKNHNIIRHPDMPAAAFQNLWDTVKAGHPWRGIVKNRAKGGDHYWVAAMIVPIRQEGRTTGYLSVRSEPSRESIKEAEALYARLNAGHALPTASRLSWRGLSIRTRMFAVLSALYIGMALALAASKPALNLSWREVGQLGAFAFSWISVTFGAFYLVARTVMGKLDVALGHLDRIAQGILTDDIDIGGRNEEGQLLNGLAAMQANLTVMLDEIKEAARAIDSKCAVLEGEMKNVVEQSHEQRGRVQSVAAATEQFSASIGEVAEGASAAALSATQSQKRVEDSNASMTRSQDATARVVEAVQASSATIGKLNQSIEKIGTITQSIKDIADQTNLLALNAAIEAARAGELGRGFAVVADEVRKLAERTTLSTGDISARVAEIQSVTGQTVAAMAQAMHEVESGTALMKESLADLDRLTEASVDVASKAQGIAEAASAQAAASHQVAANMEQVSTLIDRNTQSAQEAWGETERLAATAGDLKRLVDQFKLARTPR